VKKFVVALIVLCLLPMVVRGQEMNMARLVPQTNEQIRLSFAPLVKKSAPAVVNIYAARRMRARSPFRLQSSLGSGVLVDARGLVVTNYHVIRDAEAIKVALSDGREFTSHLILEDEASDIAILQLESNGVDFPTLSLGNSDVVEVGDLVLAIGNPFGVGQTVTSGIVSAQARSRVGLTDNDFFIQTDAAINPGNSGGALVNMAGELIGINTAIYSRSGGSIGIGFAIPSNLVRAIVAAAKQGEDHFDPPYFGASLQSVTGDIGKSLGLDVPYGALVTSVAPDSPAAKAGVEIGDVIITAQGARVDNPDSFGYRLLTTGVGGRLKLEVLRDGQILALEEDLLRQPQVARVVETITDVSPLQGAQVIDLPNSDGVVISGFERGSAAAKLFQTGDVLYTVNGQAVRNITGLKQILAAAAATGRGWQFEYNRGGVVIRRTIR